MSTYFFYTELLFVVLFFTYLVWKLTQESSSICSVFSEAEKKVRRNWYLAFVVTYGIDFIAALCLYFLGPDRVAEEAFITILTFFPSMAFMYYFPYLKSGTKWLGAYLVLGPLGIAVSAATMLTSSTPAALEVSYLLFTSLSLAYFWIHSKRLYDLNNKSKKDAQSFSSEKCEA